MKKFLTGCCCGAGCVILLWVQNQADQAILSSVVRRDLIAHGCAWYNPTNGYFQLKGHRP
jgi:hypothetical protein